VILNLILILISKIIIIPLKPFRSSR